MTFANFLWDTIQLFVRVIWGLPVVLTWLWRKKQRNLHHRARAPSPEVEQKDMARAAAPNRATWDCLLRHED